MNQKETGLRIGVVSYDYDPPIGGLGVLAATYVKEMKLMTGNTLKVLSPACEADDHGSLLGRFRFRKSLGCPLFSLSLLFSLKKFVRRFEIQVLHIHAGSGGVFLLRKPPCPVVVTAHHTYRQEAALVFQTSPLKRISKLCMSILERRTYLFADKISCVSRDTKHELIQYYGISPEKISVIENPVPLKDLSTYPSTQRSKTSILFVGRLEERKGVKTLLSAFSELSKSNSTIELRLIGKNLMGTELQRSLESLNITRNVCVLGHIEDSLRFREMSEACILVVPSVLEGFGLVAAEGMMLGCTVVVSDAPGLRSLVTENKTGKVFPVQNARALARVIEGLLSNEDERTRLGIAAKIEALERFSIQKRAKDLVSYLKIAADLYK